jgi:hypothetical protein
MGEQDRSILSGRFEVGGHDQLLGKVEIGLQCVRQEEQGRIVVPLPGAAPSLGIVEHEPERLVRWHQW